MPKAADLPNDVEALKGIILERSTKLEVAEALLISQKLELEKLRFEIAYLKRMKYGRSSEQLDRELVQMQLSIEDLEASLAAKPLEVRPAPKEPPEKPARRPLPAELPREEIVHENPCACPDCGGKLRPLGEDVSEMLEYVPSHFKVIKHVRPKLSCASCQRIVQPSAPSRPIERGLAGPGLLAHVLVSKYCDHLPLYRQSQIYAREGIDLDRSTLADWVGGASALLEPLVGAIGRYVLATYKMHGDDTPVPVLCPGRGTTKQGRLWTYVRDDRPAGSAETPGGVLPLQPGSQGRASSSALGELHRRVAGRCLCRVRPPLRREDQGSRPAGRTCGASSTTSTSRSPRRSRLRRSSGSGDSTRSKRRSAAARPMSEQAVRQARAGPELKSLHDWLHKTATTLSKKSELAKAIRYALSNWVALTRYCDDGRLEVDNNAAERALRAVALGRKNWLFAGSDDGGERAAAIYTLLGTAKLNDLNPESYLRYVLERIADHPINKIDELLPWNLLLKMPELRIAA